MTISLGKPGNRSGYNLTGLRVGERLLTGVVMCTGLGFRPGKHPLHLEMFPQVLDELVDADPDAYREAVDLLSEIAAHYHGVVNAR